MVYANKKKELIEQGYTTISGLITDIELVNLKEALERVIKKVNADPYKHNARLTYDGPDFKDTLNTWQLISPELYEEDIVNLLGKDELQSAVRYVLGTKDLRFGYAYAFWSPKKVDYKLVWHRDIVDANTYNESGIPNHVCITIALNDDDGFWAIPGSHKRGPTEFENPHVEKTNDTNLPNTENVVVKAGDILFFNSWLIHRGEAKAGTKRRMIQFRIEPIEEQLSANIISPWMQDEEYLRKLPVNVRSMVENLTNFHNSSPPSLAEIYRLVKKGAKTIYAEL